MTVVTRCTINTAMGYRVINTQNSDKSNIKVQQGGKEFAFEICNDGGYRQRMAQSYDNMVQFEFELGKRFTPINVPRFGLDPSGEVVVLTWAGLTA